MDGCPGKKQNSGKTGRLSGLCPFLRYAPGLWVHCGGGAPVSAWECSGTLAGLKLLGCCAASTHLTTTACSGWGSKEQETLETALRKIMLFCTPFDAGLWRTEQKCKARRFHLPDMSVSHWKHLPPGKGGGLRLLSSLKQEVTHHCSCKLPEGPGMDPACHIALLRWSLSCHLENQKLDMFYKKPTHDGPHLQYCVQL